MRRHAERPLRARKARDRAAILPLVGATFWLPPLAGIFQVDATLAGVPVPVLCVFGIWAVLIVGAAVLAPRLAEAGDYSGADSVGADHDGDRDDDVDDGGGRGDR